MARTKMTRHQLKEQDEITTSLQKFSEFVYDRKNELIGAAVVLAVVIAGIFGWNYYSTRRMANAQNELAQAINFFNDTTKPEKERYEKALAQAQKTYQAYSSLPAGKIAQYYMALSQDELGNTNEAVQNLQGVIQDADPGTKAIAQFALGTIYKKHGDNQKAIEIYKQLYDSGGYSKAAVTLQLAEVYEANKETDQAREYYQKIVSDFPDSAFRTDAEEGLKRLGTGTTPTPAQKPS